MFSLAQNSDTHLGGATPLFRENFGRVVESAAVCIPDLIVATGDVSLDGADSETDRAFAARALARLPRRIQAVPGNYDVGDHPQRAPRQPFSTERLDRFERHFRKQVYAHRALPGRPFEAAVMRAQVRNSLAGRFTGNDARIFAGVPSSPDNS